MFSTVIEQVEANVDLSRQEDVMKLSIAMSEGWQVNQPKLYQKEGSQKVYLIVTLCRSKGTFQFSPKAARTTKD